MNDIMLVADKADMIINGYAFTKDADNIKVLNLNNTDKSVFLTRDGKVLETSMDDIEIEIVKGYMKKNIEFMEE